LVDTLSRAGIKRVDRYAEVADPQGGEFFRVFGKFKAVGGKAKNDLRIGSAYQAYRCG
jgi:hypothetical protein